MAPGQAPTVKQLLTENAPRRHRNFCTGFVSSPSSPFVTAAPCHLSPIIRWGRGQETNPPSPHTVENSLQHIKPPVHAANLAPVLQREIRLMADVTETDARVVGEAGNIVSADGRGDMAHAPRLQRSQGQIEHRRVDPLGLQAGPHIRAVRTATQRNATDPGTGIGGVSL